MEGRAVIFQVVLILACLLTVVLAEGSVPSNYVVCVESGDESCANASAFSFSNLSRALEHLQTQPMVDVTLLLAGRKHVLENVVVISSCVSVTILPAAPGRGEVIVTSNGMHAGLLFSGCRGVAVSGVTFERGGDHPLLWFNDTVGVNITGCVFR